MKIQNVLDTKPKKSAMDYWIDNVYSTKHVKDSKKLLPKQKKIFFGTDYGPDDKETSDK